MSPAEPRPQRDQPLLTGVAVTSTLLVLPVIVLAGDLSVLTVPGVLLAAGLMAAGRDNARPLAALLIVAGLWLLSGPDAVTPWSLVLATLMLTMHSAVALRSSVPPGAAIGFGVVRGWLQRGALVVAVTALVYLVGIAVNHLERGDSEVVVVLALGLLGGLVLLLRQETLHDNEP
jgi:hypothetical protein